MAVGLGPALVRGQREMWVFPETRRGPGVSGQSNFRTGCLKGSSRSATLSVGIIELILSQVIIALSRFASEHKFVEVGAGVVIRVYEDIGMRVSYSFALRDQNRLVYRDDKDFTASLPTERTTESSFTPSGSSEPQ
jgi:hypothetical protein